MLPLPDRVVLATGETVIPCYVAGYPIDEITWYHKDKKLPYVYRQSVAKNGSLIIRDTTVEDEGQYTCVAKGGGFMDSSEFHVTVKSKVLLSSRLISVKCNKVSFSRSPSHRVPNGRLCGE